jgi:hypothetical protein
MLRTVFNLGIILLVGVVLFVAFQQAYTPNTAKIIVFGYFLLTLRLYELLDDLWKRFSGQSATLPN